ncbi:hypothetical protein [Agarivorans sp. QJM3NY_33]|uniref:hypothetical protein n=1 Tax=Agarivorans sp. QJM3NY_33 TaxID=3421432 RepID=UPI003D7C3A56
MSNTLAFVHVGLPKCASTYLQHVWSVDPLYDSLNLNELMNQARKQTTAGTQIPINPIQLPPSQNILMGSSEGFSWSYCNQPQHQAKLWDLHKNSASLIAQAQLTDTILLLVRNPFAYMRSLHEQSIKEGAYASFAEFFRQQRALIEATLDIQAIIEAYQVHFAKVVILNVDELRQTPDSFWQKYQQQLQLAIPEQGINQINEKQQAANSSLGNKLPLLAALNAHSAQLLAAFDQLDEYKATRKQEFETLRSPYANTYRWFHRRLAEYSDQQAFARLGEQLGLSQLNKDAFQKVEVDKAMLDFVETRFITPLQHFEQSIEAEWLQDIKSQLEQYTTIS